MAVSSKHFSQSVFVFGFVIFGFVIFGLWRYQIILDDHDGFDEIQDICTGFQVIDIEFNRVNET